MSDDKKMTVYSEANVANLVNQYDEEFQVYKSGLKLPKTNQSRVSPKNLAVTKVLVGSFLALMTVSIVLASNYLEYRVQVANSQTEKALETSSWVFPIYFIAGVFSVSSVLAFKKAIK